ncbi:MAG: hypothetical protein J6B71_02565, partial [Clostridia bacterium]|nr:hypothetical protein [Clostridia bacterium]
MKKVPPVPFERKDIMHTQCHSVEKNTSLLQSPTVTAPSSEGAQTVDKTNGFRQIAESFGQAFSKACAVEAAQASSPSAEGEKTCFSAFFFLLSFFFCAFFVKRK